MLTSLFTAVSGMDTNGLSLSVIGDNIANINTIGFKASRTAFSDVLSQSLIGTAGSSQIGRGVMLTDISPLFTQGSFETSENALDMAIDGNGFFIVSDGGANYYTRAGQFSFDKNGYIVNTEGLNVQGYLSDSAGTLSGAASDLQVNLNSLIPAVATDSIDLSLNLNAEDSGTFIIDGSNDAIEVRDFATNNLLFTAQLTAGKYTGEELAAVVEKALGTDFTVNYNSSTEAFTIDNTGASVTINWNDPSTTAGGILGFTGSTDIVSGTPVPSNATSNAIFTLDKDGDTTLDDIANYNFSTTVTVYDSQGGDHEVNIYYEKITGNEWKAHYVYADPDNPGQYKEAGEQTLTFGNDGSLTNDNSSTATLQFDFATGLTNNINFDYGSGTSEGGNGLDSTTQFASDSAIMTISQNGFGAGTLSTMNISEDGIITGVFTNGQTRILGQIVLASFSAPQELLKMGGNLYSETFASGQAITGNPDSGGFGRVLSNSLELSNVDLAEEFIRMIAAQRGFQANSKVITTTDELLQEVMNLKR